MAKKQTIKIISWNVNGIRAVTRKGVFVPFIEKYRPDILCLQETKAERGQAEIDLPEYREFWNSAEKKGYSGTALFSKSEPLAVTYGFPDDFSKEYRFIDCAARDAAKEGRIITAEYGDFFIVTVYTPNAKDDLSRLELRHKHWDPAFLAYCRMLEKKKPVIFCGDLNVAHTPDDLAHPKENEGKKGFTAEEREGIDRIIEAGFADTFRMFHEGKGHYTWWSHWANARARNVGWRIDYVFASAASRPRVKEAYILPDVLGSDHCPVGISLLSES